jgi:hypothetical protein
MLSENVYRTSDTVHRGPGRRDELAAIVKINGGTR